jgi:hypothetical protein
MLWHAFLFLGLGLFPLSSSCLCDEYSPTTIHCITLYMYSLLIPIRAFHRKDVQRGYVATVI